MAFLFLDMKRLPTSFFQRHVLEVAPELLGKKLCRRFSDGTIQRYTICEVEAYDGQIDLACHASRGKTERTKVMFEPGGRIYMYLIYGMYWMLNIVTGEKDQPQAILIRGVKECIGPGRLTRLLQLDKSFYGEELTVSERIWVEDAPVINEFQTTPRINVDYAGEPWVSKHWRWLF